jgi:DNA-binding GntR family transcriptional regulator
MATNSYKLSPQRETYVDKIVELVEEQILSGTIPPESKISEGQLAKEFGVSRGPAREALNRLEDKGLVEKKDFGRNIKAFDINEYRETYELRIIVEAYCTMQAAVRSTEKDHKIIRDLVDQMGKNLSPDKQGKLRELVLRFHDYIVECSKNETLIKVYQSAGKKIRWANTVVLKLRDQRVDFREHRNISDMIINREPEKARTLMERHTTTNMELLLKEFEKKRNSPRLN